MGAKGLSETAKLTLKMAYDMAVEYNQEFCGTEHILYSILTQKNSRATLLLRDMDVDVDALINELEQFLDHQQQYDEDSTTAGHRGGKKQPKTTLDHYGTDLTGQARAGKLDPGRRP